MNNKKNIVITGGSSGLGLNLALAYAKQGHNIGIIARNAAKLAATEENLKVIAPSSIITTASADVALSDQANTAVSAIATSLGGIDILINSAGVLREGRFEDLPIEVFHEVMNINLFGIINVTKAALSHLKQSQGQIVNIASMAALTGVFGYSPYTASKHALAGFTESLRYELKPQGVCVQLICPPEFDSPMVDELDTYRTAENKAHTLMIPKHSIEVIVNDTMKAISTKQYFKITGFAARLTGIGIRYFPGITQLLADKVILKAQQQS